METSSSSVSEADPLYRVEDLEKSYALGDTTVRALRDVNLTVDRGEMMVIAGPSGSGKTTLLNLLGALDSPDRGTVRFGDLELGGLDEGSRTRLRRDRLGFVFQNFNLVPVLTAEENVAYPLLIAGVGRGESRRRAREVLKSVGLGDRTEHRPDELSGGQRQRVAIARALVHEPDAVLADEPTGNLDSETGDSILDLMAGLNRERGTTFLVATHDARIIGSLPRRLLLRDGEVVADGPPKGSS